MSLIINNNLSALNTHRNLSRSGSSMSKAIEKLSSGYKINVGADDPSGLIISEQLRSQISGLERAVRNSSEASNLIGIAEGALNEMNSILKKMRALAIHAANSGVTSPEQVAADQAEMDSGIATLDRIANTTRYSDQYLLNGSKELVYDINTIVNGPNDHQLLDTKQTRVDQIFKRDGVKMSVGFAGEKNRYQANTETSAKRAYLEADNAEGLCQIDDQGNVTAKQEFILTGSQGSRMFTFKQGEHIGEIVSSINNVRDSTGIGAALTFASDIRIDKTTNGTYNGSAPDYDNNIPSEGMGGYDNGTYVYKSGDIQIYGAGLNDPATSKIKNVNITPDAAASFKVGFNCDGDGKIYAKIVDKSTNSIEYYKDKECTMLIGKGDDKFFAATNNSGIPSSPTQHMDGIFIELNDKNCEDLDVFEIGFIGQRLDNQKDMNVTGLQGWTMVDNSVISGVNLGVNTSAKGQIYFRYSPVEFAEDGKTVKSFKVEAFTDSSYQKQYLVASSGTIPNNMNTYEEGIEPDPNILDDENKKQEQIAGQTVRLESVEMANGQQSGLSITLTIPKPGVLDGVTGMTLDDLFESTDELKEWYAEYQERAEEYEKAKNAYTTAKDDLEVQKKAEEAAQKAYDKAKAEYDKKLLKQEEAKANFDEAYGAYLDSKNEFEANLIYSMKEMINTSGVIKKALEELNKLEGGYPTDFGDKFLNEIALQTKQTIQSSAFNPNAEDSLDGFVTRVTGNIINKIQDSNTGYYRFFTDANDIADANRLLNDIMTEVGTNLRTALTGKMQTELDKYESDKDVDAAFKNLEDGGNLDTEFDKLDEVDAWFLSEHSRTTDVKSQLMADVKAEIDSYFATNSPAVGDSAEDYYDDLEAYIAANIKTRGLDSAYALLATYDGGGGGNADGVNFADAILADMFLEMKPQIENHVTGSFKNVVKDYRQNEGKTLDADVKTFAEGNNSTQINSLNEVIDPRTVRTGYGYSFVKDFVGRMDQYIQNQLKDGTWTNLQDFRDNLKPDMQSIVSDMLSGTGSTPEERKWGYIFGQQPPPNDSAALDYIQTITDGIVTAFDKEVSTMTKDQIAEYDLTKLQRFANAVMDDGVYLKDDLELLNTYDGAGSKILRDLLNVAKTHIAGASYTAGDSLVAYQTAIKTAMDAVRMQSPYVDLNNGGTPNPQGTASALIDRFVTAVTTDFDNRATAAIKEILAEDQQFDSVVDDHEANNSDPGELWTVFRTHMGAGDDDTFQAYLKSATTAFLQTYANNSNITDLNPATFQSELTTHLTTNSPFTVVGGSSADLAAAANNIINSVAGDIATSYLASVKDAIDDEYISDPDLDSLFDTNLNLPPPSTNKDDFDLLNNTPINGVLNNYGDQLLEELDTKIKTYLSDLTKYDPYSFSNFRNDFVKEIKRQVEEDLTGVWSKLVGPDQTDLRAAATNIMNEALDMITRPEAGDPDPFRDYTDKTSAYLKAQTKLNDAKAEVEAAEIKMEEAEEKLEEEVDKTKELQEIYDDALEEITELNNSDWPDWKKQYDLYKAGATDANSKTPTGEQVGSITFTNLGMRIYSMDYGSAETIRIQNKTGQLFYQYLDDDSLDKKMVAADTTVQVAGDDAQISLNGAPSSPPASSPTRRPRTSPAPSSSTRAPSGRQPWPLPATTWASTSPRPPTSRASRRTNRISGPTSGLSNRRP